ncbi:hypothetical protein QC761_207186 [Podospora bellae-mahoneyi]|uniref:Uncharacterized protein n=1 Tax=Podospora bellae-mahoneyi TaxID=2093777 RepID=A0ABR0FQ48_9PEZI|nr:hypothetical protein QC761_207186 [Podospora bellae-mahoneyi]
MIFTIRQHSQIAKLFISFSMKCLLAITGFAALAIATPALPRAPTPTGQVPSPPTYEALLEHTGGCQNVSEPMGGYATAIQVERQVVENCKVTLYSSKDCDLASEAVVAIPGPRVCVPAEQGRSWKSYSIRECSD